MVNLFWIRFLRMWLLVLALLPLCSQATSHDSVVTLHAGFSERNMGLHLSFFEDASTQLGIDDIQSPGVAAQFQPSTKISPSFGYTTSAYWSRFTLNRPQAENNLAQQSPLYLTLAYAQTDFAELWCTNSAGQTIVHQRAGDHIPRAEWPTTHREPTFKIATSASTCWLRVQSSASLQLPLTLYSETAFINMRLSDNALQALYFGALLVMLVYNSIIAASTRSLAYGSYALFLLSYGLFQCAFSGLGYALLWTDAAGWADKVTPFFITCTAFTAVMFASVLLDLRQAAPRWFKLSSMILFLYGVTLLLPWLVSYSTAIRAIFAITPLWAVFLLGSGAYMSYQGVRVAKIYLAAWIVFITGTLTIMASRMGWVPVNAITANATQIGSAVEFIMLSFALADRIKTTQKSLLDAQKKIANTLRASEQELNDKVKERTAELESANSQILSAYNTADALRLKAESAQQQTAQALQELKATQNQLIAAEKMASLGLLVSNVAHEINTPISAIQSSGGMVSDSMEATLANMPRLLDALSRDHRALFLHLVTQTSGKDILLSTREERQLTKQVTTLLENAGIDGAIRKARLIVKLHAHHSASDYLPLLTGPESDLILNVASGVADVLSGTSNINAAAAKIARMVASLKELTGNDRTTSMFENPVHQSIEKAIATLESKLHSVDVVRNYQDIAPLHCDPDALQQVWMHLINNALYASNHQGVVLVGLRAFNNQVEVRIADFGRGIAPDIKDRIFEPFFTTRTSGEGGGMGLSIAKKIVELHKGRIEVQSEVGSGTTFTVVLPYTG